MELTIFTKGKGSLSFIQDPSAAKNMRMATTLGTPPPRSLVPVPFSLAGRLRLPRHHHLELVLKRLQLRSLKGYLST